MRRISVLVDGLQSGFLSLLLMSGYLVLASRLGHGDESRVRQMEVLPAMCCFSCLVTTGERFFLLVRGWFLFVEGVVSIFSEGGFRF
jgi:hypothetical protein